MNLKQKVLMTLGTVGVAAAVGDGLGVGPGVPGATFPIVGRSPPPPPNGALSDGELTTSAATAAAAAPVNASDPAISTPRRTGGRSPVFWGDWAHTWRAGVIWTRSAATLAAGADP